MEFDGFAILRALSFARLEGRTSKGWGVSNMKTMTVAALAAMSVAACALAGCASVFEGTSQDISVVSNPIGARCAFKRTDGQDMGVVESTPGRLTVRKSKYDLTITCNKPGYQTAAYVNHSGTTATIAANVAVDLLLTAGISSIVDSSTGADNKYDSVVNITLIPETGIVPTNQTVAPVK